MSVIIKHKDIFQDFLFIYYLVIFKVTCKQFISPNSNRNVYFHPHIINLPRALSPTALSAFLE